jgi:Ca2+-binding RTX toxin-like protein
MTIWDGGGIDTYDFSNYGTNKGCTIDLRPGRWTTISPNQLADLDGATGTRVAAGNIANSLAVDKDGKPVGSNGTPVNLIENVIGSPNNDQIMGNDAANRIAGGGGADTLTGLGGNDTFVFNIGQANGDTVVDFTGNGAATGEDALQFVGYGPGATLTQNDATHWQVNYNGGLSHEVITFMNGASIHASDYVFA